MIFITEMNIYRMGIPNVSSIGKENFGVLDELGYSYEGNQLFSIDQLNEGVDFYGRTGYAPESGTYTWNEAGLLNSDSSRGILSTTYNHLGLPIRQTYPGLTSTTYSANGYVYSADGTLLSIHREAKVGTISSSRYYSGSRIFEGNALEYSYFPGGYFDASGAVHYTHTDYQGSIIAVTDSVGKVVQSTGYYPYGEPWREPSGQPMLFAGKERTPQADYLFGPRTYNAAGLFWHAPDCKASSFTQWSPYAYCGGNPIGNIDPTGYYIQIIGQMLTGAFLSGLIDASIQTYVNMEYKNHTFCEAIKEVDQTSVVAAAGMGALFGPMANISSISKASTAIKSIQTFEQSVPAIETSLVLADAAVDYSESKGLEIIGSQEYPKDEKDFILDLSVSLLGKAVAKETIQAGEKAANSAVNSKSYKALPKEDKAYWRGLKKGAESEAFKESVSVTYDFIGQSFRKRLDP